MAKLEDAFLVELAVHTRDRIGVYYKRFSKIADWGKAVARFERSCLTGVPDLLLELEVYRYAQ